MLSEIIFRKKGLKEKRNVNQKLTSFFMAMFEWLAASVTKPRASVHKTGKESIIFVTKIVCACLCILWFHS